MSNDRDFLTAQILAEHSKAQTMRIVRWIGHDAGRLAMLMEIFLGHEYRLTQRSAWVVRYVNKHAPELMERWLPEMVARLSQTGIHDAVKRNVLNIFEAIEIPDALQDELTDLSFGYLADPQEAVAIWCAAMTILVNICRKIQELKPELRLLIGEHFEHSTAGFKSRGKKALRALESN